jgi:hypothetical protein
LCAFNKRKGALSDRIYALRAHKPPRLAAVTLANKLAQIAWATMMTGEAFRDETLAIAQRLNRLVGRAPFEFGKRGKDAMNDMVATKARDTTFHPSSAMLAAVIRNRAVGYHQAGRA